MVTKILLIIVLLVVFYRDYKHQLVEWFLFPLAGLLFGVTFYIMSLSPEYFFYSICLNLMIVLAILLVLYLYSRLKLKTGFINKTFGLGDAFILMAVAFGFPTITFILLLALAMIFTLLISLLLKKQYAYKTVPFAGYVSLFFAIITLASYAPFFPSTYLI
ncbi:general secretion pathway protein [Galbibacter sp. EGI 63066]|uniref:general secretion pathway protein n=1 Tax=Galbibacter sp. EGI 63066 TaxID=2993559 RepID=UPI002248B8A4|nr:general secretion pathway protein [Galbibacter sp. EGI 63066]MCX2679352.1 general secretion pathway protein [Galbibacter sp. EGI 63066]